MGAFAINFNKEKRDTLNTKDVFKMRGHVNSFEYSSDLFQLSKFKKIILNEDSFLYQDEEVFIIGSGTISYKKESVDFGFKQLALDIKANCLLTDELFGHYTIISFNSQKNKLNIFFDQTKYGAPYVIDKKYISSSFLACLENSLELQPNHEAIFEEIYTGCYLNGNTTFKEIRKIISYESWNIDGLSVEFIPIEQSIDVNFKTKRGAIDSSLTHLKQYFNKWKKQFDVFKVDIGLSSGYDSRLLLSLTEDSLSSNYQVHSYWKKNTDFDIIVAKKLAATVNKNLILEAVRDRDKLSSNEFLTLIDDAMLYYDGLFPSNHGWVREYRTSSHRIKILKGAKFGLSGLSGEQYRNDFHLLNKSYSLDYIVKNLFLEDRNEEVLKKSKFNIEGLNYLKKSIIISLNLKENSSKLTRKEIQQFYCEMWVCGGPGIRNQIENTLTFFLSPFTEGIIQQHAYSVIDYLGIGGRFQAKMIKKINFNLSAIISDYGFSFDKIPIKHDIIGVLSSILGRKRKITLAKLIKGKKQNYLNNFGPHKSLIEDKINYLKKYNFEFPIESPFFSQDTIDRLIALSTLLKRYEYKIKK